MKGKFFIQTYGCQMNVHDTEYMCAILNKAGYAQAQTLKEADIILLNTCAVRQKAEEKVYSFLGRLKAFKKRHPGLIIGVGGCVAQKEGERILKRIPYIDLVFGTHQFFRVAELIEEVKKNGHRICCIDYTYQLEPPCHVFPLSHKMYGRAYLTIMQGCDNFCSYCIVPYVRGRQISRRSENVINEAKRLLDVGIKEIILLGQNVNSYGQDRPEEISFSELLFKINKLPGLKRLRFITSHPKDISPDVIKAFADLDTLCEHIHLPVQSGSDRILKRMGRKYTRSEYLQKIEALRKTCPEISITTDLIVGFPGETKKDFKDTISLLQEVEFDAIFAFRYSDRPPAKAVSFSKKIDEQEKAERLSEVLEIQAPITERKNRAKKGRLLEVLLDSYSKQGYQLCGRTRCNRVVNVEGDESLMGHIVEVIIEEVLAHSLKGKVVKILD
ncbi:MAG: tRNA (N6-isopentenyl adenosine(37)-C2)-methylthiotransferase MiaB [Candidatus Desulfofervidus auxilii]|nr:tRNA (N6-isopentenyl adenosine(37)-C2)-methylthiotransferase MiaB [Candidatus Desulfofervidus auxilii]